MITNEAMTDNMETIDVLLEQGLPQTYIAAAQGVTRQAINQRAYPQGWKKRWSESNRIWLERERKNKRAVLHQFSERITSRLDRIVNYFEQGCSLLTNLDYFEQRINAFTFQGIAEQKTVEYISTLPKTSYTLSQLEPLFVAYFDAVEQGEKLSYKKLGMHADPPIHYGCVKRVLKTVGLEPLHSRGRRNV